MHPNQEAIHRFYSAFSARDHATMAELYADDATFSDPVFRDLDADEVRAMWRMFCTGDGQVDITFGDIEANDDSGTARWEAVYRFPQTNRRVHNVINASFTFRDGKIVRHEDSFDLYRWMRMSLGPPGAAIGWTPFAQNAVRKQAAARLASFRAREEDGS